MKSNVIVCPFTDTERLSHIAETGIKPVSTMIDALLNEIKAKFPQAVDMVDRLDNLYLTAIVLAQNETLREYICTPCDTKQICENVLRSVM